MKKLALIMALLFLGVGVAGAADFSVSGTYGVGGAYLKNAQAYSAVGDGVNARSYTNYDHDLDVNVQWKISDATKLVTQIEIRDETWGGDDLDSNDDFRIEQVYGAHTFGNSHQLAVGLMSAGCWGTTFGDNPTEAYRVKYTVPTSAGTFLGILQKNTEGGAADMGEDSDSDTYYLAAVTKLGDMYVKPLFFRKVASNPVAAKEAVATGAILALNGAFGNVGYEAEGQWSTVDMNQEIPGVSVDYATYGLYGNVWLTRDALKFGALGAFGSYDDEAGKGFDFGDDFYAGGALLMGDYITFLGGEGLAAGRLLAGYFDYAANEKLSFGGYLGYAECGADDAKDGGIWNGATVNEISGDVTYKITSNLSYKVQAGTAQFKWGGNTADNPDRAVKLAHSLSFSF